MKNNCNATYLKLPWIRDHHGNWCILHTAATFTGCTIWKLQKWNIFFLPHARKAKSISINHLSNAFWLYWNGVKNAQFQNSTLVLHFCNVSNGTPCITNFKLFEITSISKEANFLKIALSWLQQIWFHSPEIAETFTSQKTS